MYLKTDIYHLLYICKENIVTLTLNYFETTDFIGMVIGIGPLYAKCLADGSRIFIY